VDGIENGLDSPEIKVRLAERRQEREALVRQAQLLTQRVVNPAKAPTVEWIADQLKQLARLLSGGDPAAALALRELVGGQVIVREIRQPGRKRFFAQGMFIIQAARVCRALNVAGPDRWNGGDLKEKVPCEEIVIEFRDSKPSEVISDQVKELWDRGLTYQEMAKEVGWNRNIVTEALAVWFRQRGLEPPDGRSCKNRLDRKTLAEELADQAKAYWDQGLLMQEISDRLGCNRDTATKAIQHWFGSRGLEIPDGRIRRKDLFQKSSKGNHSESRV
jgi:hypothetical protein